DVAHVLERAGEPADELGRLSAAHAQVQRISPELGALLAPWYDRLVAAEAQSQALALCFNHGDFTAGQVLFDGHACGLIDFDSVCQAEPALDIAQFLTYLTVGGQKSKRTAEETRAIFADLTARFVNTYLATAGYSEGDASRLMARVEVYRGISLLRRVLRSWQKMKPGRIAGALAMMQEALAPLGA
ncbi:MAG TPA: phosphotransferase, partial [Kouleothrix sp.]|nr:phosphotransferase [Kouleothrix sp.]